MLPDFNDAELLTQALTHTSFANEQLARESARDDKRIIDNQRLEFLGDSIVNAVTAEWLYRRYPDLSEGRLTTLRAALVRAQSLAQFAEVIGLPSMLRLGKGENDAGGRQRVNVISDAFEAVVAALYLDQGFVAVRALLEPLLESAADAILSDNLDRDPKTRLQEWSQTAKSVTPRYEDVASDGPAHARVFHVQVWLGDQMAGEGSGNSKQLAERAAAEMALRRLSP